MRRLITVVIFALATGTLAQTSDTLPHLALAPAPLNTFTLPAGTHVLMTLTSPLHTTSARAGAGVYLETSWPVVQDGQVVIPAHSRVLGEVEHERRPGRVKGRAQFRLHFTSLILPVNRVVAIAGNLQSLPGNEKIRAQDKEGTIEPVDQIDSDVYRIASGTIAGGLGGALTRTATGAGIGMAIGGGLGLAKVLFTRGDEIHLPEGTKVEMVLEKPLTLAHH
jgi:hypothetical protein